MKKLATYPTKIFGGRVKCFKTGPTNWSRRYGFYKRMKNGRIKPIKDAKETSWPANKDGVPQTKVDLPTFTISTEKRYVKLLN